MSREPEPDILRTRNEQACLSLPSLQMFTHLDFLFNQRKSDLHFFEKRHCQSTESSSKLMQELQIIEMQNPWKS